MVKALISAETTSIGAGVTKTQINNATDLTLPGWTKNIESVTPWQVQPTVIGASEEIVTKFYVESTDFKVSPYRIVPYAYNGTLQGAAITWNETTPLTTWPMHVPVSGGENMQVWGESLVDPTNANYAGATFTISDLKTGKQKFAETGTFTSVGTTATTDVVGTAYTLYGCERIVKVYGHVTVKTPKAATGTFGLFKLKSSDFTHGMPVEWGFTPSSGALSTSAMPYNWGCTVHDVDIPTHINCAVTDYAYAEYICGTVAGYFITGVLFEKSGFT